MQSRRVVQVAYLMSTIVFLFFGAHALAQTRQAPPQEVEWTKIDCAGAHLLPPPGMKADCFDGGFEKAQGNYDCKLNNVMIGTPAEGNGPHFNTRARYPRVGTQGCVTMGFPNAAEALQHFHRFLAQAANWSDVQTPRNDIQLRFFDAKTRARDGRCFSFIKNGPTQTKGKGYQFTLFGFFCKPPGQPVDAAAAIGLIDAIQLKP